MLKADAHDQFRDTYYQNSSGLLSQQMLFMPRRLAMPPISLDHSELCLWYVGPDHGSVAAVDDCIVASSFVLVLGEP